MEFNLMAWISTRLYSLSSAKNVMAAEALAEEARAEAGRKVTAAVITPNDATVKNAATSGTVMFGFEPTRAEFSVVVRAVGYAGSYVYEFERQP